ncbi:transglutaminase TgpA family protein [Metapseudomonas boanensis]|uniref:transglutaminase TgpA family protein n=1 Tax=Metapseudomonas boanensis TaxID=2822138 RepID=UPI0032E89236
MSVSRPLTRIGLTWLLVAQVLVILPHLQHLPIWIIGLWLGCAAWRVQIFRMRVTFPNAWVKAALIIGVGAGVVLSRGTLMGLDAAVVLLVAVFILKLVEMRSQRDALVLILLGFFTQVTAYLFNDGMLAALYSLLPLSTLLAALVGLQQSRYAERSLVPLTVAGSLLLQAVPLMLLLFLFFPRLGPLWSLPMPSDKGITGLSDSMSPADVAELSQSGELAFRASFDGPVPASNQLYWRALTLERFDGRRWSQALTTRYAIGAHWEKRGAPLSYSIVMQPSGKPWLFALDVGQTVEPGTRQMSDFRLERQGPVDRSLLYQVTSWPEAVREAQGDSAALRRALQLPKQGDPRTRAWARELKQRYTDTAQLVGAVLEHFRSQSYVYTLRPPTLGSDSIDAFLFDSRRGFCAHYAGAMTFILRAAGIPARVVAGYQGGELNPAGNYVLVHQFDAHAWVEYWAPGRGWVSVDPTFQVAPNRIELGLEEAVASEESFLEGSPLSPLRYRQLAWLNQVRLTWDNLNYGWQRWVLGYQGEAQGNLFRRWFGTIDYQLLGVSLVAAAALILATVGLFLFRPWRREQDPQVRLFQHFERILAQQGVQRSPGEGPRAYAERACLALPQQAREIHAFLDAFEACQYAGRPTADTQRLLRAVRRALPWRLRRPR